MSTRPEIFISAASRDLKSCRQLVRDALLTLGCVPVVQDHFPPAAGAVRDMLRAKIAACDAVIHLAGECYGFEPQERAPSDPRRSYTQLEYDIARELKKPLFTFLCAPDFPYDAHHPEPDDLRALQDAHRAALAAGDHLYVPLKDTQELNLRVRELQTRVEMLSRDLQKTRNWLAWGLAAALVALALIGGVLWWQHRRTARTEQTVAQVSDELDRYRQAVKALADSYGQDIAPGRKVTDEEKFDRALAAVAVQQHISVGELKTWMALFVTQVRANPGADFYDKALADFAEKHFADAATNATKSAQQFQTQREAAKQEKIAAGDREVQAAEKERRSWTLAGDAEYAAGRYAAASEPYREALTLCDKAHEGLIWCGTARKLANSLFWQNCYKDAEALMRLVVDQCTAILGAEHSETLLSIGNLANILDCEGDNAEAERLDLHNLEVQERLLGKDHPDTLMTVNNLGTFSFERGDYAMAESLHRRSLDSHPDDLTALYNLALDLLEQGHNSEAELLYRRCLAMMESQLGKDHPNTIQCVNDLGILLERKGAYTEAEVLLRRSLDARERILGPEHRDTLYSIDNLANLLRTKGDFVGAKPLFRRYLEAQERALGEDHPNVIEARSELANCLSEAGEYTEAIGLYKRCLVSEERTLGKENSRTLETINSLALALTNGGDYTAAEPLYHRCLEAEERTLGKENPATLCIVSNLAQLLDAKGDYTAAEPLYIRAETGMEHAVPLDHPYRLDLDYYFSLMRQKQDRLIEALPMAEHAASGAQKSMPVNSPDRLKYEKNLADLRAKIAAASPHHH